MNAIALLATARMLGRGWVAIAIATASLVTTPHTPWRVLGPLTTPDDATAPF